MQIEILTCGKYQDKFVDLCPGAYMSSGGEATYCAYCEVKTYTPHLLLRLGKWAACSKCPKYLRCMTAKVL